MIKQTKKNTKIGIALLAYSRPNHLAKVLSALKSQGVNEFSVYIDGADDQLVRNRQSEIENLLLCTEWANISIIKRSVNLGLRRSIISAVSDMLSKHDAVIVIEDDCLPLPGYFQFMRMALLKYENNMQVRSICGYQFEHLKYTTKSVSCLGIYRFIPWGWATWKNRWVDYETDLKLLSSKIKNIEIRSHIPRDIIDYIEGSPDFCERNDVWSINWILTHYITKTLCVYPTKPLIQNIGFDGSGVHCFETNAFEIEEASKKIKPDFRMGKNIRINYSHEKSVKQYIEKHWSKTILKLNKIERIDTHPLLDIKKVVSDSIRFIEIFDFHTHLYPPQFNKKALSGLDEILTYHYLFVEALNVSGKPPSCYFKLSKEEQAEFVWNELFLKRTPFSEASIGVLSILNYHGIDTKKKPYSQIKKDYSSVSVEPEKLLNKLNIKNIVMTNDPFDKEELLLFEKNNWNREMFLSAIRIDNILANERLAFGKLKESKFPKAGKGTLDHEYIYDFLCQVCIKTKAVYLSVSLDGNDIDKFLYGSIFQKSVVPFLLKHNMPLALMIGVKRNINPSFGVGGDGLGNSKITSLEKLISDYPEINFIVTHLHQSEQYELTVLSRKFQNLSLFGIWWFLNQPNIVEEVLNTRFNLLGMDFIPQHSDARVFEQLIYKWDHFKNIIENILIKRYNQLFEKGWFLDESIIKRDVRKLFFDNAKLIVSK